MTTFQTLRPHQRDSSCEHLHMLRMTMGCRPSAGSTEDLQKELVGGRGTTENRSAARHGSCLPQLTGGARAFAIPTPVRALGPLLSLFRPNR
jgi:hypothetical protein